MKHTKKLASLLLALALAFALAVPAMAAGETGSITIKDADNVSVAGKTFNAYYKDVVRKAFNYDELEKYLPKD